MGLVSALYSDIFSVDFLTPLQEADTVFNLKVINENKLNYTTLFIMMSIKIH